MVLILTSVLILSILGMAALLYVKHWELSTGKVLFGNARPHIADVSHRALVVVEHTIPGAARSLISEMKVWVRTGARAAIARAWFAIEHALERALHFLRNAVAHQHHDTTESRGSASAFLREVAEHKRHLMRRRYKEELKARQDLLGEDRP
ncbi:MAG TPA: hypothetical protein VF803_02615 [Candidatus Paceibacterota bacterium]